MYLDYFCLDRHPFRITPDTSLFYSGGAEGRGVVLDAILYAIESGEGILKVVGEVGSGKTMLCRMLEEKLPDTTEVVYIANPNLTPDEIIHAVAIELKLLVRRDTPKLLVMQQLQLHLLEQHAANRRVLVIIEEAQSMPVETLEEIRLFSNLETHRDKLMQIAMFGQPELDRNLRARNIRQLRERITHSFYLSPLERAETADYIRHRLGAAGCPKPNLFTATALWLIARTSRGLTRRINILADKALLAAFVDNALKSPERLGPDVPPVVKSRHVVAAIRDCDYETPLLTPFLAFLLAPKRLVLASTFLVLVLTGYLFWPNARSMASQLISPLQGEFNPVSASLEETPTVPVNRVPETAQLIPGQDPFQVVEANPLALLSRSREPEQEVGASLETEGPGSESASYTEQRLLAAAEWLRRADPDSYTIQILSGAMDNLAFAENFLASLDSTGLLARSYLCLSTRSGKRQWSIKYGDFEAVKQAQKNIDVLPNALLKYQPFVQNMNTVECAIDYSLASLTSE